MTEQLAQYPNQPPFPPVPSDEIDLRLLVRALWRGRWWIVGITLLGAALGLGLSLWSTKYQSRGLFLTPDVSIGDYKTYAAALNNLPRWQRFVELSGQQTDPAAELITKVLKSPDPSSFGRMIAPVFSITDSEAKQFGVKVDESNINLVGLNLTLKTKDITKTSPINLLAEYVRSTIIRADLREALQDACTSNRNAELVLTNAKLQNAFTIQQDQKRRDTLNDIIARLPASARVDSQIVSMDKDSTRFLSPTTQLVGVDVAIANTRLDNIKQDRDLAAAKLKADYYCKAREALQQPGTGESFLAELPKLQDAVFKGADMKQDVVLHTANELKIQHDQWSNRYLSRLHFVVSPEGAELKVRKPGLLVGLVLGGILGGIFGALFALFRNWWGENREVIVSSRT